MERFAGPITSFPGVAIASFASLVASSACVIDDDDPPGGSGLGGTSGGGGRAGYAGENFPPPPTPGVCGDGQIGYLETCDDSNTSAGDGCDPSCRVEPGWSCSLVEHCINLFGDQPCSADACSHGVTCVERGSRLGCACPSVLPAACESVRFLALSLLPDTNSCSARDLSADGATVVGVCSHSEPDRNIAWERAFRWSASTGTRDLGLSPGLNSDAVAVSADGSIIVGSEREQLFGDGRTYRLSPLEVYTLGLAAVTSMDAAGSVVVGHVTQPAEGGGVAYPAAFWTPSGTSLLSSEGLDGDISPLAISGDGRVVVGSAKAGGVLRAVRWDWQLETVTVLPAPDGAIDSEAWAASSDGSVIVGASFLTETIQHVMRWTPNGLDDLGPGSAGDVSADGAVLLNGEQIWDSENGWRSLRELVTEAGIDLTGWEVLNGEALSDDGKVVVGSAQYLGAPGVSGYRAFRIELP